jgi:exonuclease SbcC
VNGAGKSALLESVLFALWGRARTNKEEVRTAGVNGDCIAEVEFEHEGHLYVVRRTISGASATVRAQAHADGAQVAEGARDTTRYVHSILGMDDVAFRASVFAEQRQLAAFSDTAPAERRRLVLQLLGITPLDGARDQARRDARTSREQLERLRGMLPDLAELAQARDQARAAAEEAESGAGAARAAAGQASALLDQVQRRHDELDVVGREHDALVQEGKLLRAEADRVVRRTKDLDAELARLEGAGAELARLEPAVQGLTEAEERLERTRAVSDAEAALARVPAPVPPGDAPDEEGCEESRAAAAADAAAVSEVAGALGAALEDQERARRAHERAARLSGEAECPLCGQALGDAFEQVQSHRDQELAAAGRRVAELTQEQARRQNVAGASSGAAAEVVRRLEAARVAWREFDRARERRGAAEQAHAAAVAALGRVPEPGEHERLAAVVDGGRKAALRCAELRALLQRRVAAGGELEGEAARLGELQGRLEAMRDKVKALGFHPEQLKTAKSKLAEARDRAETGSRDLHRAEVAAAQTRERAESEARRLAEGEAQHARLENAEEEARHLGRVAELLGSFRNTVVATVGPRLSAQAGELFAELTDREYDGLKVDPETYDIQICDAGQTYGMDRFSGSETDLANLALRVAISEHVRFQSGGAVGLLVLDEVFGPLDDDRKERMLMSLERLRGRFRQVVVVTHANDVKDQLPNAIQVVKLPGRRGTARLLNA